MGPAAFRSGLVLIAVIVVYDFWHKTNPLSPLLMAAARALVYITAGLASCRDADEPALLWAGILFAYIVGLTAIAKAEAGSGLARLLAGGAPDPAGSCICRTDATSRDLVAARALRRLDGVCRLVCLSYRPAQHRPRGRVPHRRHRAPGCAGPGGRWFRDRGGSRAGGLGYDALSATLHQGNMRDAMRRTVVINAVGLTPDHLGATTPCLSAFAEKGTWLL